MNPVDQPDEMTLEGPCLGWVCSCVLIVLRLSVLCEALVSFGTRVRAQYRELQGQKEQGAGQGLEVMDFVGSTVTCPSNCCGICGGRNFNISDTHVPATSRKKKR